MPPYAYIKAHASFDQHRAYGHIDIERHEISMHGNLK